MADSADNKSGRVTAAVLINPLSLRNRRGRQVRRVTDGARAAGVPVIHASSPDTFDSALDELLEIGPEVLVIMAGDGTIQAMVTRLLNRGDSGKLPLLYLVRGGRTNLTANDVNRRGWQVGKNLESIFRDGARSGETITRPVMEVRTGNLPAEYGFFVAGAVIDRIIRDTHEVRRNKSNGDGRLTTPIQVARSLMGHMTGRNRLPAFKAHIRAGKLGEFERPVRILLATSLHRIGKGIDPFADRGQGRFQFTAIASGAPRIWRRLPGLLRGQLPPEANARSGYISGLSNEVTIEGMQSFCLDGEYLEAGPDKQVVIRSGPDIRFLVT